MASQPPAGADRSDAGNPANGRPPARPIRTVTLAELLGQQPGSPAPGHPAGGHARRVTGRRRGAAAVLVVAGLAALVVAGLPALRTQQHRPDTGTDTATGDAVAAAQARQWLTDHADGPVLADGAVRRDLVAAGFDPDRLAGPAACTATSCPPGWLVSTPALRADSSRRGSLRTAARDSGLVAVFGSGADRVEIRRSGAGTADQGAAEHPARVSAGRVLSRLPRVDVDPEVRNLLDTGRADPRVIAMIATLAVQGPVRILDLPPVPGEDAAGQPRRQLLLAAPPDGPSALLDFFAVQTGPYRPIAVTDTPTELLVRYPPVAPPHLLQAFDGS